MSFPAGRAARVRVVAMLSFGSGGQAFERSSPHQVEVRTQQTEAIRIEAIDALRAHGRTRDQPGVAQDPEVEGDGRPRHGQLSGELAHRPRAGGEQVHDGATSAVTQRVEHVIAAMFVDWSASVSNH
jgi:hypothetical protein